MEDKKKSRVADMVQFRIWSIASAVLTVLVLVAWLMGDSWNPNHGALLLFFALTNLHIAFNHVRIQKELIELRAAESTEREFVLRE